MKKVYPREDVVTSVKFAEDEKAVTVKVYTDGKELNILDVVQALSGTLSFLANGGATSEQLPVNDDHKN